MFVFGAGGGVTGIGRVAGICVFVCVADAAVAFSDDVTVAGHTRIAINPASFLVIISLREGSSSWNRLAVRAHGLECAALHGLTNERIPCALYLSLF